ncbi:hypothetical protein, partial [Thomasclavelia ramosa]|uniref:hypothetical protein n=2 Tax=Thomasclavelia ramosa TaxID=1547 RepID=UPI00202DC995
SDILFLQLVAAFILYHVRFFIITPLKLFETPSLAGGFIADKKTSSYINCLFFQKCLYIFFSNLSDSSNLYTTNELGLNVNIFIMSLPFYFNNNPIGYTDFLVFRTNKMVGLAGDIDFSRNTSGSLTTAI